MRTSLFLALVVALISQGQSAIAGKPSSVGRKSVVTSLGYSPDGKMVYAGRDNGSIEVWEAGRLVRAIPPVDHNGMGLRTVFSSDGALAVNLDAKTRLPTLWEMPSGKRLGHLPIDTTSQGASGLSISPAGDLIALSVARADVVPGETREGRPIYRKTSSLQLWNVATRKFHSTLLDGERGSGGGLSFSADGSSVLLCGGKRDFRVWDVKSAEETFAVGNGLGLSGAASFLPQSPLILHFPGALPHAPREGLPSQLIDLRSQKVIRTFPERNHEVESVTFDRKQGLVAFLVREDTAPITRRRLVLRDLATGKERRTLGPWSELVLGVAFSPDGTEITAYRGDSNSGGRLTTWDVATGVGKSVFADDRVKLLVD